MERPRGARPIAHPAAGRRSGARLLGVLLITLLAAGCASGSRPVSTARATTSTGSEASRHPAPLLAPGLEALSPDAGTYLRAFVDADGETIWLQSFGRLTRYESGTGAASTWTVADDLGFDSRSIAPARAGGVWLVGSPPDARTVRWFDGESFLDVISAPADVTAAVEAPDGGIWVATGEGTVHRWDGRTWVSIGRPHQFSDTDNGEIAVDGQGAVWVGWTRYPVPPEVGGVARFDGTVWTSYGTTDAAPLGGLVRSITPLADGSVWVATSGGLARYDAGKWHEVETAGTLGGDPTSVAGITDDATWLAGASGDGAVAVGLLHEESWTTYSSADGLPEEGPLVTAWILPTRDSVHVATGAGLYGLEGDRWNRMLPATDLVGPGWVWSALPISRAEAWLGDEAGLWRYREGTWSRVWTSTTVDQRAVVDLAQAADGAVWAATQAGTVRCDDLACVTIDDRSATAIAHGGDGAIWVASGDQVHRLDVDGAQWRAVDVQGLPDIGEVHRLAIAPSGDVWAAGILWDGGGLARFDGSRWVTVEPIRGAQIGSRAVDIAANGDVWVALSRGETNSVARLHDGGWEIYGESEGVRNYGYSDSLSIGPDGSVWVAGYGLMRFDGHAWRSYLEELFIPTVAVAPDDSIWVSGLSGIFRYIPD